MSKVKRRCKVCTKMFYAGRWQIKEGWGIYCSIGCKGESQKKGRITRCFTCGSDIWRGPGELRKSKSEKFFCSKSCQTVWRNKYYSGPNHPFWKGGINTYRNLLLSTKKKVECVVCKENDARVLQVHHKDGNHRNNSLDNLVWLCVNCHRLVHLHNEKIPKYA